MTLEERAAGLLRELLIEGGIDPEDVSETEMIVEVRQEGTIRTEDFERFIRDLTEYSNALADETVHLSSKNKRRVNEMQAAIIVAVSGLTAVEMLSELFQAQDEEEEE